MIVYRVYNDNGGYTEFAEEPQGVNFEIIYKTLEEISDANKPIIPDTISVIPFFVQLELMGITEQDIVDKIIELHQLGILSNKEKIEALISVKRATKFERSHPFIGIVAQAFNISESQVDEIFINGNIF
ncbi:hypothetical protein GFJ99_11750 [Flavobacterium sp. LMO6]|uniref:Uncharacterized protein n=1 Tax=Flavobacterium phage vB_FspS_laban6-1 TaxID=2686250 RepID=A0A6B9LJ92_9CAUD|nr:hypothetical protein [Flavobacterium sp. LMO6]YP_009854842.1 hypothetical protein HWC90_gp44 [Flavobacterium phage vB_FspS_laban6-1]MQP63369.1 hypothetical protein [Flavobacterium sp. LMO6]QHB39015.1 hypothetical protein laban61_gp044 [Flavobacterium phage vB_FspS_laban6-1]